MLRTKIINDELFRDLILFYTFKTNGVLNDVVFSYDLKYLMDKYKLYINDKIDNIFEFVNGLYRATITKQIFFDILKYFRI